MYDIVADNKDFILIDKFPGVGFHRDRGGTGLTGVLKSELNCETLYPVHRLDKMTSGLLVVGKSRAIARELAGQFYSKTVEKYYVAISDKRPKKKQGLIMGDMERTRRGMWKLTPETMNPAVTQFFSRSFAPHLRLFILKPHTGKTHQLRVALKSIGSPVLGDPLYYKTSAWFNGIDRGYLHCFALRFQLKGEVYQFVKSPAVGRYFTDELFRSVMKEYQNPWDLKWPSVKTGLARY